MHQQKSVLFNIVDDPRKGLSFKEKLSESNILNCFISTDIFHFRKHKSPRQSTPPPAEIEMVDETGYNKPSTSIDSYTTHDNETSSSDDDEEVFHTNSQDERKDTERFGRSVSDEVVSGSDSSEDSVSDESDEDDDITSSSDEDGTLSSGSDENER